MKRANLILSIAAGLAGGIGSHFLCSPNVVQAQAPPVVPNLVQAHSFELLDQTGQVVGTFSVSASGSPRLALIDHGRTIMVYPQPKEPLWKPLSEAVPR